MFCNTRDLTDLKLNATDGQVGEIDDLYFDDHEWVIRYMVADTGQWLPGRKVLLSPTWLRSINWEESDVHIDRDRQTIKDSPEYEPELKLTRELEKKDLRSRRTNALLGVSYV